jgi:anti-sigma B factor antagonist
MDIKPRDAGDVTVLDMKGKILIGDPVDLLRDHINRLVERNKVRVLLNFAEVPMIDSSGLGEIVKAYTTITRHGGKIKILNLTNKVRDLLVITKLVTVFEIYEDEREALDSF